MEECISHWNQHSFPFLDGLSKRTLHLGLWSEVRNASSLQDTAALKGIQVAFMNAELILDEFQVLVAATKALYASIQGEMITKNVHTETVFLLSGSKNMKAAFQNFGINPNSRHLVAALFDASPEQIKEITSLIEGKQLPFSSETTKIFFNEVRAKQVYKVTGKELNISSGGLLKAIINSISTKDA